MRRPLTVFDAAAAAAVLAAFLFFPYGFREAPLAPSLVVIEADGERRTEPLEPDRRLEVAGPLGVTVIEIAGGRVRVAASPCANQTCVRSGDAGNEGRAVVCAPNRVAVYLEEGEGGKEEGGIDATAR